MVGKKKKSFFQVLLYSSFFSLILVVILVLILIGFFRTFFQKKEISKEISALEEEVEKLEGEKSNLLRILEYLKSDFYKEKEAREKFEMQKPGEKVIVILPPEEIQEEKKEEIPNPKKWWDFLFKREAK